MGYLKKKKKENLHDSSWIFRTINGHLLEEEEEEEEEEEDRNVSASLRFVKCRLGNQTFLGRELESKFVWMLQ